MYVSSSPMLPVVSMRSATSSVRCADGCVVKRTRAAARSSFEKEGRPRSEPAMLVAYAVKKSKLRLSSQAPAVRIPDCGAPPPLPSELDGAPSPVPPLLPPPPGSPPAKLAEPPSVALLEHAPKPAKRRRGSQARIVVSLRRHPQQRP